jgi:hypothetical protein
MIVRDSFSEEYKGKRRLGSESSDSEESEKIRKHKIDKIFDPAVNRSKLIITVEDTGIGIKRKD